MGRRALRKIDSELDLSRHYHELEQLQPPWNPAAWFERSAPIEIEIGSGKGLFLAGAARTLAGHDFVGIEIARKYARFAAARLARQQLSNARMIQGDGLRFFREFLGDSLLHAVHVYFPDPWWKKRHRKRRVMTVDFMRDIERTLIAGGRLHFWTDVGEYFEATLPLLAEATRLEGPFEVSERPAEHDLDYRTHFERRMRLHGLPVFRAEFRKPLDRV